MAGLGRSWLLVLAVVLLALLYVVPYLIEFSGWWLYAFFSILAGAMLVASYVGVSSSGEQATS